VRLEFRICLSLYFATCPASVRASVGLNIVSPPFRSCIPLKQEVAPRHQQPPSPAVRAPRIGEWLSKTAAPHIDKAVEAVFDQRGIVNTPIDDIDSPKARPEPVGVGHGRRNSCERLEAAIKAALAIHEKGSTDTPLDKPGARRPVARSRDRGGGGGGGKGAQSDRRLDAAIKAALVIHGTGGTSTRIGGSHLRGHGGGPGAGGGGEGGKGSAGRTNRSTAHVHGSGDGWLSKKSGGAKHDRSQSDGSGSRGASGTGHVRYTSALPHPAAPAAFSRRRTHDAGVSYAEGGLGNAERALEADGSPRRGHQRLLGHPRNQSGQH